jgi:F-type H+-transporting ATPase subunit delta
MKGTVLSRRYAVALADMAEGDGCLEHVADDLRALADAFRADRALDVLFRVPGRSRAERSAVLSDICVGLEVAPLAVRIMLLLIDKNRTALLPDLADSFREEAERRMNIHTAVVTSAVALTAAQKQNLRTALEDRTTATVQLDERIDDSLVAGFLVELDGHLFDGSLRGRLDQLKHAIITGAPSDAR